MTSYELRLDYADGTFEVVSVPADSIGEAVRIAEHTHNPARTPLLLAVIDHKPQRALAFEGGR